jgi:hypothetical protein
MTPEELHNLEARYAKHPRELREQLIVAHVRAESRPLGAVDLIESYDFGDPELSTKWRRVTDEI